MGDRGKARECAGGADCHRVGGQQRGGDPDSESGQGAASATPMERGDFALSTKRL
jgi:hypothetical protein